MTWNEVVKGWEYEKGCSIIVDEKAFEKASPDVFKTIDIEEFVDLNGLTDKSLNLKNQGKKSGIPQLKAMNRWLILSHCSNRV
ncbi:MAG: hypothetical protein QM652_01175 [Legionella sp.]